MWIPNIIIILGTLIPKLSERVWVGVGVRKIRELTALFRSVFFGRNTEHFFFPLTFAPWRTVR